MFTIEKNIIIKCRKPQTQKGRENYHHCQHHKTFFFDVYGLCKLLCSITIRRNRLASLYRVRFYTLAYYLRVRLETTLEWSIPKMLHSGRLLALLTNIRLGYKGLPGINTLAHQGHVGLQPFSQTLDQAGKACQEQTPQEPFVTYEETIVNTASDV